MKNSAPHAERRLQPESHMIPDYYKVLGVDESAALDGIKQAYRRMAMKCHPDHGGSHEAMLEINEAFEVLRDPELRREYDYARANQDDATAQAAAARTAGEAREEAGNYPREWDAFEVWLNGIAGDFQSAKYGNKGIWPTAEKSITAWIFIAAGVYLGFYTFTALGEPGRFMAVICLAGGGWLGQIVHRSIRGLMAPARKPSVTQNTASKPATKAKTIVVCPNCSQQLRVPAGQERIRIRCTSCNQVFTHPKKPESHNMKGASQKSKNCSECCFTLSGNEKFCPGCGNPIV